MANNIPANPKIYHIVHVDRLASILSEGCLWSDAAVQNKELGGTMIGMYHMREGSLFEGDGIQINEGLSMLSGSYRSTVQKRFHLREKNHAISRYNSLFLAQ